MKYLPLLILLLAGCTNGYKTYSFPILPDDLKDCKFYRVDNEEGESLNIVRCPLSVTSTEYRQGKTRQTTVVIDGDTYQKVDK